MLAIARWVLKIQKTYLSSDQINQLTNLLLH